MSSRPRIIRCKICSTPIPNHLQVCPTCGADLEAKPLPYLSWAVGVIAIGTLVFGYFKLSPVVKNQYQTAVILLNPPTATATATATSTPTLVPTATPTDTPTRTPTPSPSPTATASPTPTPTDTPSPEPTRPNAPTATPSPSPTPTPRFAQITLTGPADGTRFAKEQEVLLQWEPAGELADDEWYAVRMNWLQGGARAFGGTNTKDPFWIVPPEQYYGLADLGTGRVYEWHVFIEKTTTDETGQTTGLPVSPPSETRTFFWP